MEAVEADPHPHPHPPSPRVDAVEIDPAAAREAARNFRASPWGGRMRVANESVQDYAAATPNRYDLVVSNPPYFTESLLPPEAARSAARHTVSLTYGELIGAAAALLWPTGLLAVIVPYERAEEFVGQAAAQGLYPVRRTDVKPTPHGPARRALLELSRQPGAVQADELVIESEGRHGYSPEYIALTRDFYLKF